MSRLNMIMNNEKQIPTMSVSAKKIKDGYISMIGKFDDYINKRNYVKEVKHGIIYIKKTSLGSKTLTVLTRGKQVVNFSKYGENGTFIWNLRESSTTRVYCFKSFYVYKDKNGKECYVYSDMNEVSIDSLS